MFRQTSDRVRTRSFRAALIVLAVIGVVAAWRKWTEPRYHGRGIRSWIEQLPYDTAGNSEAQEAMRYFGNDAVPYLIDAMTRGAKWDSGLLAKIPRNYVSSVVDLAHYQQVRRTAIGKLEEMAALEALENELQLNPKSPVLDQILPVWERELRRDPANTFTGLYGLSPLMTNFAPLLRDSFEKMNPQTDWRWFDISSVLAQTHDPTLVPVFLRFATPTNALMHREWALIALARNGCTNDAIPPVLREALSSTNGHFRSVAVSACAYLNICTQEALTAIGERREASTEKASSEIQNMESFEPIIRWRANTNDLEASATIERNLRPGAKYSYRFNTSEALIRIGPDAKQFVATLVQIARTDQPPFQTEAVRALKSIAPDEARKVMATLPPRKVLHATSAVAK